MSQEPKFVMPHAEIGYEVEFAPTEDSPEASWSLAKVVRVKNNAVDVRVLSAHTLQDIPKMDVRHLGDPSLRKYPPRGDSGVFRLSKNQLELNGIRENQATILRRMDALEQTFKAVVDQGTKAEPHATERKSQRPATGGVPGARSMAEAAGG